MDRAESISKFPEVVVVQASAGAGKTYELAKRYLHLLINPKLSLDQIPLKQILAITFTNKATFEMKKRILEFLKKIALNRFSDQKEAGYILGLFKTSKEHMRIKACRILDQLIKDYHFFQVQTIDSFINTLLLGSALNIDRSAGFKIKREYILQLAYSFDLAVEQSAHHKEIKDFFEEFLRHYLFIENREGWFPKKDILKLIDSLYALMNRYGKSFFEYSGEGSDVLEAKAALYSAISKLPRNFPAGINKRVKNDIAKFLATKNNIFEIKSLPRIFSSRDVAMEEDQSCPKAFEKKWQGINKRIKDLVELEATAAYKPYIKLFRLVMVFFESLSKKEDKLFLQELNCKTRSLFEDNGLTVAETYYRLATCYKHYLIDEFQDTSLLQWSNLEIMIEEALSGGGSFFYVGDKKQAIYRFRGGDAGLFDKVRDKLSFYNVSLVNLTKNWRSQKVIVEFNNLIFSQSNIRRLLFSSGIADKLQNDKDAIGEIAAIFEDAKQEHKEEHQYGYVCVSMIDEKNKAGCGEIMRVETVDLIKEIKRRFEYKDIAVLTRDNDEVKMVSGWLIDTGMPVESEKTLNILENNLIKEILAFLKFLSSPIDDLNFAAFISGDIFSSATGMSNWQITMFLFSLNRNRKNIPAVSLYNLFRDAYPRIWSEYIEKFFKTVGFISTYELVVIIYQHFSLSERFKDSQAFLMRFLELVKIREEEYVSLDEFLEYLENAYEDDLYVQATSSDAIKVLTIHKAKGLEFPVVIIPFLRMDISPETGGKGTKSYIEEEKNNSLGLVRITEDYRIYSERLNGIYMKNYKKSCIDELNNIYVAFTRAQHELYLYLPAKSGNSNNKARYLVPEGLSELGSKREYAITRRETAAPHMEIPPSTYDHWINSLRDEFVGYEDIRNREVIKEGNILHALLSQIGNCRGKNVEKIIKEALLFTGRQFVLSEEASRYEVKIKKLLSDERFRDIFFVQGGEVFCEKEIVDSRGNKKRLDRLIVREDDVSIVDYKSRQGDREGDRKQVKEYMALAAAIFPRYEVKGYLLYLNNLTLCEVDG
ncbi:MAG: UvrD-helicase domain-containing protein [Candidatus Omnitrophota bacterium]